jgi:hypothetical protein
MGKEKLIKLGGQTFKIGYTSFGGPSSCSLCHFNYDKFCPDSANFECQAYMYLILVASIKTLLKEINIK